MTQPHALVIDDNSQNMNVLAMLLGEQGVGNTLVKSTRDLDGVLDSIGSVDVVFLDIEMPIMNGYDVLRKLKDDHRFDHTPIVAYTVHTGEINAAQRQGFDSFIGKPINPDKFPDQLARILTGTPVWDTV